MVDVVGTHNLITPPAGESMDARILAGLLGAVQLIMAGMCLHKLFKMIAHPEFMLPMLLYLAAAVVADQIGNFFFNTSSSKGTSHGMAKVALIPQGEEPAAAV